MNDRFNKGIALALAMSVANVSLTLVPATYAAEPNTQNQSPYYRAPVTGTASDRNLVPDRAGSPSMPLQPAPPVSSNGNYYAMPPAQTLPTRTGPTLDQMVVDGLILRPVMLVATALGTAIFIATLPASVLGGNVAQAGRKMVVEPAESTFATCLGCLMERNQSKYESWH